MSKINCPHCNELVGKYDTSCQYCGKSLISKGVWVFSFLVGFVFFLWLFQDEPYIAADDPNCRKDFNCWARENIVSASIYCPIEVEMRSNFDFEWTDAMLESKFGSYQQTQDPDVIVYFGDKVRFQNSFGAWQNMSYACEFNTVSKQIVSLDVQPGRLTPL